MYVKVECNFMNRMQDKHPSIYMHMCVFYDWIDIFTVKEKKDYTESEQELKLILWAWQIAISTGAQPPSPEKRMQSILQ